MCSIAQVTVIGLEILALTSVHVLHEITSYFAAGNDGYLFSEFHGGPSYIIVPSKFMGSFPRGFSGMMAICFPRSTAAHPT